jgi:hypothetical protein
MAIIAGLAAAAVSAGVGAYSAKKANKATNAQTDVAQQQLDQSQQLLDESAPLRGMTQLQLMHFLLTGSLPADLYTPSPELYGLPHFMTSGQLPGPLELAPTTAANRDVLESQFTNARTNVIEQSPAMGGHLADALTDLEGQRALGVTQLYTDENAQRNKLAQSLFGTGLDISREQQQQEEQKRRALFAAALGTGTNQAGLALGGLSGASTSFGNVASTALKGLDTGLEGLGAGLSFLAPARDPYLSYAPRRRRVQAELESGLLGNPELY